MKEIKETITQKPKRGRKSKKELETILNEENVDIQNKKSENIENTNENHYQIEDENLDDKKKTQEDFKDKEIVEGVIEISEEGYGFLRFENFQTSEKDIYVSKSLIKSFNIKTGDKIKGYINELREGEKFKSLCYMIKVNGENPQEAIYRKRFDDLTPIYPKEQLILENENLKENNISSRIIDLISPIGKGQRGLIVSPPKVGKTTLLKNIAKSIKTNYKDIELIILLIDERPEEVTDIREAIENTDVIYSTFDEEQKHHIKVAEIVINRAKALVEMNKDVVILLDSITRLARAYNICIPNSGKTLSGGLDPYALYYPKKFFGTARNTKEAGSITIIATALIDTGSKMDDVIFEEFKGTGNMELVLSRELAYKRIFPAIDIKNSSTRREDLLLNNEKIQIMQDIRYFISNSNNKGERLLNNEEFIKYLKNSKNNNDFILFIKKSLIN